IHSVSGMLNNNQAFHHSGPGPFAGSISNQQIASQFPVSQPTQPTVHASADQLLKFVGELEIRLERTNDLIFAPKCDENSIASACPVSLDDKIRDACSRVACLCGLASTINAKLFGE